MSKRLLLAFSLLVATFLAVVLLQFRERTKADATDYILAQMADCYKKQSTNNCYKDLASDILSHFSLQEISHVFEENESKRELYASCHEVMHYLGRETYKRAGKVASALPQCSHTCFEGCLHGVAEGYFIEKNISAYDDSNLEREIQTVCGKQEDYKKQALFSQCVHGIGHAVMLLTDNDVPEALRLCDFLNNSSEEELCYSGVFMENSNSSTNKDHPSKFVKKDDPLYPCPILNNKYQGMCYELQSFKFFEFSNHDWQKTIDMCGKVPQQYRLLCFKTIGSSQVGFTKDVQVMRQNCQLVENDERREACIRGVVGTLSTRFGGDSQKIISFCAIVDQENDQDNEQDNKKACYDQMGLSLIQWVSNTELQNICSKLPESQYMQVCLGNSQGDRGI